MAPPTGPRVAALLRDHGLGVQDVVRRRATGYYVLDFWDNENQWGGKLPPADDLRQQLESRFTDVRVVDSYTKRADWRPGRPVLSAMLIVDGVPQPRSLHDGLDDVEIVPAPATCNAPATPPPPQWPPSSIRLLPDPESGGEDEWEDMTWWGWIPPQFCLWSVRPHTM